MAEIFISYAREDRSRVEPLAKALEDQGWSVWWDPRIPPGKTFFEVIKEALEAAKCVVVLWSKQSIDSEWVLEEAYFGKRRGILIPAKIDSVDPPLGFGLIQAADLTDWNEGVIHPDFENLVNAIENVAKPSKKETISVQGRAAIEISARSEVGYVLNENQDRMMGAAVPLGQLYIVADGGGNTKGGALAAELTVQGLNQYIGIASRNASADEVILGAFKKVNKEIYQKAHSGDDATQNMMSTAVVLLISGRVARVAHIGDSRAYLFRDGKLKRLTRDHTKVQKMVEAGILTPEEAAEHPNANMVERAIGNELSVDVDISDELPLQI
jgi:hypothetical protein